MKLVNSIRYFTYAGHDYAHKGVDDVEPSSSCFNPYEAREYSLEQTENYPLDDEIGRRLSQMVPTAVCLSSHASVDSFLDQLLNQ